jgi:hypothetical protein
VFQVCSGYPIEIRVIAIFAMGLPLLIAGKEVAQLVKTTNPEI